MSDNMIYDILVRLEEKVDKQSEAMTAQTAQTATLSERVENLIDKTEQHIEKDDEVHGDLTNRVRAVEDWKLAFKTKVAIYAGIAGTIVAAMVGFAKDAIAAITGNH